MSCKKNLQMCSILFPLYYSVFPVTILNTSNVNLSLLNKGIPNYELFKVFQFKTT